MARSTDSWVVKDHEGGMLLYRLYAAREDTAAKASIHAPVVAGHLCVTHRWTSCRSVTPASVHAVSRTALVSDAKGPAQVTYSPAGGGTATLALVGNSMSALYRLPSADASEEAGPAESAKPGCEKRKSPAPPSRGLRQPPSAAVAACAPREDPDAAESALHDAAANDSEWATALSAARAQAAIRTALLRRYANDAWPTVPPFLVAVPRRLRSPPSSDGETLPTFSDLAFSEIDGGTRIGSVKVANEGLVRAISYSEAGNGDPAFGPGNLSSVPAIVIVAPLEAVVGVEAALRARDNQPPTWYPSARELADAMAPTLRNVGKDLNIRARGLIEETAAAEVLRMLQTWLESAVVEKQSAKRDRAPAAFRPPRQWTRMPGVPGAMAAFSDSETQPFAAGPPLPDCMPALKQAAEATLGRTASATCASVYHAARRGMLGGFVPGGCDEGGITEAIRVDGRPGFTHRCSNCVEERAMIECRWLPTFGLELFLSPPRLPGMPSNGQLTAASSRLIKRCRGLGLPVSCLGRWQTAGQRGHAAVIGHAGNALHGPGTEPSKAVAFSERRWAWRAELHADRLRFGALSLRLAVLALQQCSYDATTGEWPDEPEPGTDLACVLKALNITGGTQGAAGQPTSAEVIAIAIGVTRAVLVYDVSFCVGLVDPTLLVPDVCANHTSPVDDARRATLDDFVARHVRLFFDESFRTEIVGLERQDDRVPLTLSVEAVGPAVAKAGQDALRCDAGPAVLQAALPALGNVVGEITRGAYDTCAWMNAAAGAAEDDDSADDGDPGRCLRAMSGLRSRKDDDDGPDRSLAQHVARALGAGWFHELESFLDRRDTGEEGEDEETGRWRAIPSGDALECGSKEARQRWSLLTAWCGVRGWAMACAAHGDSPFAASAVLGVQRPLEGGAGSAALFASSTDYFSLSYSGLKLTAIAAEKSRREDAGRLAWEAAQKKAAEATAAARKDEGKARQRTTTAQARATKVAGEVKERIQAANIALAAAAKRKEEATTEKQKAHVEFELAKRHADWHAWKQAQVAEPGALMTWLDSQSTGDDCSQAAAAAVMELPVLPPTPSVPQSSNNDVRGEEEREAARRAPVLTDDDAEGMVYRPLDGVPLAAEGLLTAQGAAEAHVRYVNSLVSESTRRLGELYLAAVANETSINRRRSRSDSEGEAALPKKPRSD